MIIAAIILSCLAFACLCIAALHFCITNNPNP